MLASEAAGKWPIFGRRCTVLRVAPSWLLLCGIAAGAAFVPQTAICQTTAPQTAQPQTAQTDQPAHAKRQKKPDAAPVILPPPQPAVAPNLLEQPALPATVTTNNNELTVKADNSSLSQILHQVSSETGMKLDGLGGDERVFGNFGPGAPREVLTALLNGTSYNVMMVGDLPNGAPRELLLTSRGGGGAPPPPAANPNANPNQNQTQPADQDNPDDSASPDDSDDSAPPMQYTPPSIAPAEPPPANAPAEPPQANAPGEAPARPIPQMQNAPQ